MKFKLTLTSLKLIAIVFLSVGGLASSGTAKKVEAQNCNSACGASWTPCCSTPYCCITVISCDPQSASVYSARTCADGSRSCGSCPALEDPGDPSPGDPGPGCYYPGGLQFNADAQRKPANNATGLDPAVIQFEWHRVGSTGNVYAGQDWGHVDNPCTGQFRIYTIYLREANADGTCSTSKNSYSPIDSKEYPATNAGNVTNGGNDPLIVPNVWKNSVLKYATSYCWYVKKENKVAASRTTSIRKFTTDARPVLTGFRIINPRNNAEVPTCGTDIRRVGKYSATSTTIQNPMDVEVSYRDPDSTGDFTNLMFALVPLRHSNGEALRIVNTSMDSKIVSLRTINARFTFNNAMSVKTLSTQNLAATFGPEVSSGDLNNNIDANATILSMASATNISITTNADLSRTVVARFRIRFNDNFPNNNIDGASNYYYFYNMYTMLNFTRTRTHIANGNVITSSYSADFDQTTMTGVDNYLRGNQVFMVDTTAPNPVLTSSMNGDNSFNVVWRASDNHELEANTGFKTSVHATIAGDSLMQDYPSGSIINPVPTSEPGSSNLNAYLNLSNGVNHTEVYRDQNTGILSNNIFTLDIDDLSCNKGRFQLTVTPQPSPWLSVFNSNASIGNVMSGSAITAISPYTQLFGLEDAADSTQPYTTAYAFLLGTSALPSSYISKKGLYASTYPDLSDEPPVGTSWYTYFLDKVKNSSTTAITRGSLTTTTPGVTTSTVSLSSALGVATGTKINYIVNGDVWLNGRTNCDIRSIFVISGTLRIYSDYQITENATSGVYNGCLYVVQGQVNLINYPVVSSRTKFPATGEHATYGIFEANIFADGNIVISRDLGTPLGTFIVGGLTSRGAITSSAVFGGNSNLSKPSMLVYADPRYAITFMEDLGIFSYSIREEGFVQ